MIAGDRAGAQTVIIVAHFLFRKFIGSGRLELAAMGREFKGRSQTETAGHSRAMMLASESAIGY